MESQLEQIIEEANSWLQSELWYTLGNFRTLLSSIAMDSSPEGIKRALHVLSHHISDQFDWSAEYCKVISSYSARVDQVRRTLANRGDAPR